MKNNKGIYVLITLIIFVCLFSIYKSVNKILSKKIDNNKNNQEQNETIKSELEQSVNEIVAYAKIYDSENRNDSDINYNSYIIADGFLKNYSFENLADNLNHSLSEKDNNLSGIIYIKKDNSIYFSISNGKECIIKSFENESYEIYDVSEQTKCHKPYLYDDNLTVSLLAFEQESGILNNSNGVSTNSLLILAVSNLLDNEAATYKWYRNGELLSNTSSSYLVNTSEDAEYYIEVETFNGKFMKSEPIHVKIEK